MNKRPTHEELLEGRVPTLSLLNEPIDLEVDYIVKPIEPSTALDRAERSWGKADVICGKEGA